MEWDIDKLGDFLERECRKGVAIELKILEWKIAEAEAEAQRTQAERQLPSEQS
jgi:hypothetical protein